MSVDTGSHSDQIPLVSFSTSIFISLVSSCLTVASFSVVCRNIFRVKKATCVETAPCSLTSLQLKELQGTSSHCLSSSIQTALTKLHSLGDLNDRNFLLTILESRKAVIRMLAWLLLVTALFLAYELPVSPCIVTW